MAVPPIEIIIRLLDRDDAAALAAIESQSVGAANWGLAAYRDIGAGRIIGWAAARGSQLLGFILVRPVADEMEILNLAVVPDARRQGIARRLLARAIDAGRQAGVRKIYLEVRTSNSDARAFYSSAGFVGQGRRKNYYSQPIEDALVLSIGQE